MRRAVFLFAVMACLDLDRRELSLPEQMAVDAALDAWSDAGLPAPHPHCTRFWSMRTATPEQFDRTCQVSARDHTSCLSYDAIVYAPQLTNEQLPAHAVHEALHAFVACAYLADDRFDYAHSDPRVWAQAGGAESVQAKAMETIAARQGARDLERIGHARRPD